MKRTVIIISAILAGAMAVPTAAAAKNNYPTFPPVLSDEEKPWDCKIWPLRVMKKTDGEVVVALTPTCPHINKLDLNTVRDFVNGNLKDDLLNYADAHPYLIKEYREGYPVM